MVRIRKAARLTIGGLQCILGAFASIFAYILYTTSSIQEALFSTTDELFLAIFLLLALGLFFIASGVLLVNEKDGSN